MRCTECLGKGEVLCPVCKGTKKDPRNHEWKCSHCDGKGYKKCPLCLGTGTVPDDFKNL